MGFRVIVAQPAGVGPSSFCPDTMRGDFIFYTLWAGTYFTAGVDHVIFTGTNAPQQTRNSGLTASLFFRSYQSGIVVVIMIPKKKISPLL